MISISAMVILLGILATLTVAVVIVALVITITRSQNQAVPPGVHSTKKPMD